MPLFEYICRDCGRPFEKILPRYDSPADCIHCNSENVEKQLSVFAVAGGSNTESASDGPGCGRCGAAQPGMCGMMD
ncbi:MAG TPA: zinc ribbon domain-containing protein [Terriglobia bacterium]|nr:zinc ribbon domain-containing protein [Terriglobia bacterium]